MYTHVSLQIHFTYFGLHVQVLSWNSIGLFLNTLLQKTWKLFRLYTVLYIWTDLYLNTFVRKKPTETTLSNSWHAIHPIPNWSESTNTSKNRDKMKLLRISCIYKSFLHLVLDIFVYIVVLVMNERKSKILSVLHRYSLGEWWLRTTRTWKLHILSYQHCPVSTSLKRWKNYIITRIFVRIEVKKFRTFRQQVTWLGRFNRGKPSGRWGWNYSFSFSFWINGLEICKALWIETFEIMSEWYYDRIWEWKEGGGWLIGFPAANGRVSGKIISVFFIRNNSRSTITKSLSSNWSIDQLIILKHYRGSRLPLPWSKNGPGE